MNHASTHKTAATATDDGSGMQEQMGEGGLYIQSGRSVYIDRPRSQGARSKVQGATRTSQRASRWSPRPRGTFT